MTIHISCIVPLAPMEAKWGQLCSSLLFLPRGSEVIFVRPTRLKASEEGRLFLLKKYHRVSWLSCKKGRAAQMNMGAKHAKGKFLWFLHADSIFSPRAVKSLIQNLDRHSDQIHFFNLSFGQDTSGLTKLNEVGANLRSQHLGIPFGDQGLCFSKKIFEGLGGFNQACSYGEDHLFIWEAKRQGVEVHSTGEDIITSDRKYHKEGWLKTSFNHIYLTCKQAFPNAIQLGTKKINQAIRLERAKTNLSSQ
ncbi:MAG: glycosyltransferase [Oligoflexales bacterium]|nr:glycosyltransferase [Oligoflexales bacterium]